MVCAGSANLLAALPCDVLLGVLSHAGLRELGACMALARSWGNSRSSQGRLLVSDLLWRPLCQGHWARKAPCFRLSTPGREAALRAAHPQADWRRLFNLLEEDGHRWELTPFEMRHLYWAPYPLKLAGAAVLQQLELPRRQRVAYALGQPRPRGAAPGTVYQVLRLASWDWLLLGRQHAFVSMRQPASLAAGGAPPRGASEGARGAVGRASEEESSSEEEFGEGINSTRGAGVLTPVSEEDDDEAELPPSSTRRWR